ncbi:BTAD domain-containing putative transcriptional regulator [Micromonospora sp. SL1-18]|uniref:AfsR/SARP family transcriptional regulator n=1 Tax=Micromonospora sp. SL1-18 TaxID=3399128 RepID=UPI003A4DBE3A
MELTHDDNETAGLGFGILGPIKMHTRSGPVALTAARLRVVLAVLLLRPNQVVPLDDIVDRLWPERPPATARDQVVNVVSALRRLAGEAGRSAAGQWLTTQPPGYLARIDPEQLDVENFDAYVRQADAQTLAGRPAEAALALRAALALWRGPALADVPAPFAVAEAQRLAESRLAATEKLIDAEFAVGRHRDVVPELIHLVAEHPLREGLRGRLMTALHEDGRTADALAVYRAGRRLTIDELGLEPGPELRRIERAILSGVRSDALADAPAAVRVSAGPPAQLPRDIGDFIGRRDEVAEISHRLGGPATGTALPVIAVSGPPGVGKSALVTHVAHLMRAHYPDGQVHVDLRGTRGGREPAAVLLGMLRALGMPRSAVPDDVADRVRLFRSLTAGRRVLLVLDDAADAAQARPLLPGWTGCAVLVTSRAELAGLEGAHRIRLDALPGEEALALLAATAGQERVSAEATEAWRIVGLCGRLPLALRIAGARAASRPEWSLRGLADRLADPDRRLDELRTGDLDLRASLEPSLRNLDSDIELAAGRLASLDVADFPTRVVAAVLGVSPAAAESLVDRLMERQILGFAGLDTERRPRYRFPELIRLYVRERDAARRAAADPPPGIPTGPNRPGPGPHTEISLVEPVSPWPRAWDLPHLISREARDPCFMTAGRA